MQAQASASNNAGRMTMGEAGTILHTTEEVAEILQCSIWTVRRMVDAGEIKALRIGKRSLRIDPADLADYISNQKTKGAM